MCICSPCGCRFTSQQGREFNLQIGSPCPNNYLHPHVHGVVVLIPPICQLKTAWADKLWAGAAIADPDAALAGIKVGTELAIQQLAEMCQVDVARLRDAWRGDARGTQLAGGGGAAGGGAGSGGGARGDGGASITSQHAPFVCAAAADTAAAGLPVAPRIASVHTLRALLAARSAATKVSLEAGRGSPGEIGVRAYTPAKLLQFSSAASRSNSALREVSAAASRQLWDAAVRCDGRAVAEVAQSISKTLVGLRLDAPIAAMEVGDGTVVPREKLVCAVANYGLVGDT